MDAIGEFSNMGETFDDAMEVIVYGTPLTGDQVPCESVATSSED